MKYSCFLINTKDKNEQTTRTFWFKNLLIVREVYNDLLHGAGLLQPALHAPEGQEPLQEQERGNTKVDKNRETHFHQNVSFFHVKYFF